jgi:hypothetical protein
VSGVAVAGAAPRTRGAARPAPRAVPARRPRHLRLVTTVPRRRRLPSAVALVAISTVLLVIALVVVRVMLAQTQLSLDRLNGRVGAAQQRYDQALLRNAELAAPSHVIVRAGQLGLVAPGQPPVAVAVPAAAVPTAARTATPVPRP